MKKIEVQCAHCGELVEIEDRGFYWALCEECGEEYAAELESDYKLFYVYYAPSYENYDWGIAEEDGDFYRMVADGTHYECCFEYQANINVKYVEQLKTELASVEDDREYESIIKKYKNKED